MYLDLITSALLTQKLLAEAHATAGQPRDLGLYLLAVSDVTGGFVAEQTPPEGLERLHTAFLTWERETIQTLVEETLGDGGVAAETARRLGAASSELGSALAEVIATAGAAAMPATQVSATTASASAAPSATPR